jgi:hypothetical protein
MDIKSPQKVLHIFNRGLENSSSFACEAFACVSGRQMCLNVRRQEKIKNAGRQKF